MSEKKLRYSLGLSISDTEKESFDITVTTKKMSDILDVKKMFEEILKDKYCVCLDNMSEINIEYVKNEDTNGTVLVWDKESNK